MCRITSIRVSVQWVVGLIGRQAIGVSDQYGVRTKRFKRQTKIKKCATYKRVWSGSGFFISVFCNILYHFSLFIINFACLFYNNNGNNMKASQIGHWKIVCFLFLGLFLLVVGGKLLSFCLFSLCVLL